ncbi:2-hydroxyacid dehydrogenase [Testudinibacter sp. TR-2022]|uniref:2-hydroxyacid dehydrogenase n=1 Tax=Testudinibacter sp. TR-2022 TaxID=2585029 RepID=UPI00111A7776|nr:2-hydroxyacid dehydrogenase [Testudinibacter sp. TR-2022]TNH04437.1 2-hydroxyacid dehydrogenase [Pasteurellaceae bacterium Phil31]TNH06073.1 2-hydroxyacid dehydrogenase [Testudinibacter sp. TR-2022]TNH07760.1 2-hydroxyacid dehydrogenase [Testudinibacter sp. TR-2022]TNH14426.1 2-hydroxyacid dehydrogenase [Testudinibacter sp. TR-2022]TNH17385.1 2-hydroxyacid dehydrogenase [Testudinibacter sp. TR-2022]
MLKIVHLDSSSLPKHIPIPRPNIEHQWIAYEATDPQQTLERLQGADVAVTNKVVIDKTLMQQLPKLKLIAVTATGTNNVDLDAAQELGIIVKNVAGYSSVCVPEHVIGMIFALKHSLMGWYRDQLTDRWVDNKQFCYFDYPLTDVRNSVIGIFGKGNLGSEVGRLATAVGMQVLYAEHKDAATCRDGYTPFNDVLAQADFVSLHCPLTPTTQNLINAETLALMKKGAFLINTGRGPLVDENALVAALKSGHLGGAAIDVMIKEPPEKGNVVMEAAKVLPNLLVTPHIAWAADSAVEILVGKVRDNIEQFAASLK